MTLTSIVVYNGIIGKWEHLRLFADADEVRYATISELRQYYSVQIR